MLKIRESQMQVFASLSLKRFEDEMVVHSKGFNPQLCRVLGDEQLRVAIRQTMERAVSYGFTNRGPIRLCIELMFICGSHFDTDPQYPLIREALESKDHQTRRADRVYQCLLDYDRNVGGENGENFVNALHAVDEFAACPLPYDAQEFDEGITQTMIDVFPQKAAYVGPSGRRKLVEQSRAEAKKYQFQETRALALLSMMKYAFGHGCTNDPLYPWIHRTIHDPRIGPPETRARQLEKKSRTWLRHVLPPQNG